MNINWNCFQAGVVENLATTDRRTKSSPSSSMESPHKKRKSSSSVRPAIKKKETASSIPPLQKKTTESVISIFPFKFNLVCFIMTIFRPIEQWSSVESIDNKRKSSSSVPPANKKNESSSSAKSSIQLPMSNEAISKDITESVSY